MNAISEHIAKIMVRYLFENDVPSLINEVRLDLIDYQRQTGTEITVERVDGSFVFKHGLDTYTYRWA